MFVVPLRPADALALAALGAPLPAAASRVDPTAWHPETLDRSNVEFSEMDRQPVQSPRLFGQRSRRSRRSDKRRLASREVFASQQGTQPAP
jgi:hypothetical protein